MTAAQWMALAPLILVSATLVGLLVAISIARMLRVAAAVSIVGLNLALASVAWTWVDGSFGEPVRVTGLLLVDSAARLAMMMSLTAALGVLTLCSAYFRGYTRNREEIYLLVGLGTLGCLLLCAATHVASLLLGLELMGLPMIAAIGYQTRDPRAIEGSLKYLVLSAAASATLLFGFALIYAQTGHLDFEGLSRVLSDVGGGQPLLLSSLVLIVSAFAFKLSVVPFHQWTPDVYEAAPAPVGAYFATVSKIGAFVVLLRLLQGHAHGVSPYVGRVMVAMALASMILGSMLALRQDNLKRLMAYSSVAHFGYLLVVLIVPGSAALEAAAIYLAAYFVSALGVFGVIAILSSPMGERDLESVDDYRGLFWRRPYLASILVAMMLSLAGVPLTAGFIGKFAVIAAGVELHHWLLVGGVVLGSAISVYYYLRVIVTLFERVDDVHEGVTEHMDWVQSAGGIMLLLAMALVLAMGVIPNDLYGVAQAFRSIGQLP